MLEKGWFDIKRFIPSYQVNVAVQIYIEVMARMHETEEAPNSYRYIYVWIEIWLTGIEPTAIKLWSVRANRSSPPGPEAGLLSLKNGKSKKL